MVVPTSLAPPSQPTSSAPQGISFVPGVGLVTAIKPPSTTVSTPSGLMTTQAGAVVVREYSGPRIVSEKIVNPEQQRAQDVAAINANVASGGKYSATVTVSTPEQVQDVRTWAAKEGYDIKRQPATYDPATGQSTVPLRIISKQPIPKDANIPVRTVETIRAERIASTAKDVAVKTYESANPLEQFILKEGARLSPSGYELAVAPIAGLLGGKTEAQAVEENIATLLTEDYKATYESSLQGGNPLLTVGPPQGDILPFVPIPAITPSYGGVVGRYFQSPTFTVQSAFIGGLGLAGLGATATGAKLLYSVPGQVAGVALTAYSGVAAAAETYEIAASGDTSKAFGVGAISALSFGAAYAGFRTGETQVSAVRPVEADYNKINALSVTREYEGKITRSVGTFTVEEGTMKGLKGSTVSVSGPEYGTLTTTVPAQKLYSRGVKVSAYSKTDATQSYSAGKVSAQKIGSVLITDAETPLGVGGERQAFGLGIETARKDKGPVIFRQFKAVGRTYEGTYDLIGVKQGDRMAFVDSLNVKKAGVQDIDWLDISIGKKAEPIKPFKTGETPGPEKPFKPFDTGKTPEPTLPKPAEISSGKGDTSLLIEPAKPKPVTISGPSPVSSIDLGSLKVEPLATKVPPIVLPSMATKKAEAVSSLRKMDTALALRSKTVSEDAQVLIGRSGLFGTGLKEDTAWKTATIETTDWKTVTTETFKTPTPEDPWKITQTPPTPGIPAIPGLPGFPGLPGIPLLPGLGFGRVFGRGSVGRRKTAYRPNILGIFLGGKAPKGQLSGIEPRPFPTAKKEKPKKVVHSDRASVRRYFGI